jgi:hypothetical protein
MIIIQFMPPFGEHEWRLELKIGQKNYDNQAIFLV